MLYPNKGFMGYIATHQRRNAPRHSPAAAGNVTGHFFIFIVGLGITMVAVKVMPHLLPQCSAVFA